MQHKIKIFLKIFAHVRFGQFKNFLLSCGKRLTMKQITDKSIYLWVLKWLPYGLNNASKARMRATETAGDDAGQISARAEIWRVSELLMATNGRRTKSPNTRL